MKNAPQKKGINPMIGHRMPKLWGMVREEGIAVASLQRVCAISIFDMRRAYTLKKAPQEGEPFLMVRVEGLEPTLP
jgi:hypothetical protein